MLVNYNHTTCPKCSSAISDGGKTCGSCGAVCLFPLLSSHTTVMRLLPFFLT